MRIAFNPSTVAALTSPPNNKDITFDLRGQNIFARGVKFYGTDTNTWRDIKINNVSIGSNTLDLRNGSNTTLTNTNGVVTINSTWRPVVDNLTSDSTTSSLSANQGRVLAGLINGKSDSDHNHDDRYLKLTGGTMSGTIYRNSGGTTIRGRDHAIIRQTYAPGGSSWNPIACVDTETGTWTLGHLSNGDSDTRFSFCFSTNVDYNAGYNQGNYVHIRNIDGTLALTSEIPNKNSWNYDDRYYTKAESDIKYITDITTSVNKLTFTKNGSNIARDITVNNVQSQGQLSNIADQDSTTKADSGLYIYDSYYQIIGTNHYSSVLSIHTGGTIQIAGNWGDDETRNLYWRSQSDRNVADYPWKSWRTILDNENYSSTLDSRYYTESEVDSLLSTKLDRVNLSVGNWNPRGYNLAADYFYNGGDLSISESGGQIHVSVDGYFWQNEGRYRVLDTSDVAGLKGDLTVHQYLSNTDITWWPLIWGGSSHANTSDSTGAVYKSHDVLSWQTSSQTLYATNIQTENIKRLSIGGGIYWNPYVESAEDGSDAASITLVKSGVLGGTTLVLSQQNDANDTIQFQTNGAARLYHNSYPILTTQNTYVNNHKGYINGTEITQVNNADTLDGAHLIRYGNGTGIKQVYYFHTQGNNTSYIKLGTLNTVAVTGAGSSKVMFTVKGGINFGGTNESVYEVAASTRGSIQVTSTLVRGNRELKFGYVSTSSNVEIWMAYDGTFRGITEVEVSSSVSFTLAMTETTTKPSGFVEGSYRILASTADNVASATNAYHLRINSANTWSTWYWVGQSGQPSWLWGSNDGTNMYVWSPNNFNVNTAQYLRSLGNQNCQTGRTQAYGDVYTYNTIDGNTSSPTAYTSVIGFGRGIAGTVEIAGGWCNTHLYWRSLRDCCEDWYSWRAVLDSSNYTDFINNYYWANVKISTSSSTATSPTVHTLTATRVCAGHDPGIDNSISCSNWFRSSGNTGWYNTTYQGGWYMSDTSWIRAHNSVGIYTGGQIYSGSSIRMGNILLEHTDEINNITNGGINLNYRNSGNISLCQGGGNVGIGTMSPTYKLDVDGQMRTSGFHHSSVNSDNYILLAGGGYKSFGGDNSNPIFLGYLNLYHGNDGTISSSFSCLGYSVPFTYTRGGNYCRIYIPDTTHQVFYIGAATASVHYSGGGMDTWTGVHRGSGAWWLHCYAEGTNEVRVKGFCQNNNNNDSWWGGNPLWSGNDGANKITVCIFGYVEFR